MKKYFACMLATALVPCWPGDRCWRSNGDRGGMTLTPNTEAYSRPQTTWSGRSPLDKVTTRRLSRTSPPPPNWIPDDIRPFLVTGGGLLSAGQII